jgi:hypothetical protein
MAQSKPEERTTFDQVLSLVENLAPEAQEQLVEEMKMRWLSQALAQAEKSVAEGKVYSEEQALARLDEHRRQFLERHNK